MCLMWSRCWDITSLLQRSLSSRCFMLCYVHGGMLTGCPWLVSSSSISSPPASAQSFPVHWPRCCALQPNDQWLSSTLALQCVALPLALGGDWKSWPEGWAHLMIRKKLLGLFDSGRSTPLHGNHLSTLVQSRDGERLRLNSGQDL